MSVMIKRRFFEVIEDHIDDELCLRDGICGDLSRKMLKLMGAYRPQAVSCPECWVKGLPWAREHCGHTKESPPRYI